MKHWNQARRGAATRYIPSLFSRMIMTPDQYGMICRRQMRREKKRKRKQGLVYIDRARKTN